MSNDEIMDFIDEMLPVMERLNMVIGDYYGHDEIKPFEKLGNKMVTELNKLMGVIDD